MSMLSMVFKIRPQSSLPFYCKPASLFLVTWVVMVASLWFQISYVSYPHLSLAFLLFSISIVFFIVGHYIIRIIYKISKKVPVPTHYQINIKRLRKFNFVLACTAAALIAMNFMVSGIPPFFGFFGYNTMSYIDYGKLKQLLFPFLITLFVNAFLDKSKKRIFFYSFFAFFSLLCYVARGSVMIMLLQALIVFSIRTSMSKRKIYLVAIGGAIGAAFFVDIIGTNRTGDQIFFLYMQIKTQFQHWPTVYLWIISYVSTPISNLCWFVDSAHFEHVTWSFAYPLLPHFWEPIDPHLDIIETSRIIDGVHTYLASYFLDFSYFGIVMINLLVGMASGYCRSAQRISRKFLMCSIFLSSIGFMFFTDFFAYMQTFIELGIQFAAHWYFIKEFRSSPVEGRIAVNRS